MQGIETYFDKSLGMLLLYEEERQAHDAVKKAHPNDPPSALYGAEHLLRLIVKLPSMLVQVCILSITHNMYATRDSALWVEHRFRLIGKLASMSVQLLYMSIPCCLSAS